jgi:hypothetical protein
MWIVKVVANGVHRWVPKSQGKSGTPAAHKPTGKVHKYLTHFNGSRPFLVTYDRNTARVFEADDKLLDAFLELHDDRPSGNVFARVAGWALQTRAAEAKAYKARQRAEFACYTKLVYQTPFKRAFVGKSKEQYANGPMFDGNSMLFEIETNRYVCVSLDIVSFVPRERILSFESPVQGSDISQPYAVGAENSYCIAASVYVPHSYLSKKSADPNDIAFCRVAPASSSATAKQQEKLLKAKSCTEAYASKHKLALKCIRKQPR